MANQSICSVPGCGKPFLARGYCRTHYSRWHDGVPLDGPLPRPPKRNCSVDGCSKLAKGRDGLCGMHHTRVARHGDPTVTLRAPKHEPWQYFRETLPAIETDDCIPWPYACDDNGRAILALPGSNAGNVYVTRLLCTERDGPPPTAAHQAAHSCGNGHLGCVNLRHLRWATPIENNADKIAHGTNGRKLTTADVLELRRLKGTAPARELGQRFGVSEGSARAAYNRKSWRYLP